MRRSLIVVGLAVTLFLGLGATAFAKTKHHPVKPPDPPPPPTWTWAGFYAGVNLGYGWGSSDVRQDFISGATGAIVATSTGTVHPDGVIGGGQIGYNWQYGNWVPGLEADIQGSGQRGSVTLLCVACSVIGPVTTSVTEKLEWFGTVRARLGWTVTPETMIYATGGLAYGEINETGNITDGVTTTGFDFSKTSEGWAAGGGIENHLAGNWTWKIEYLFLTLKEPSGSIVTPIIPVIRTPPSTVQIDPIFTDNIIRAGLNYKW